MRVPLKNMSDDCDLAGCQWPRQSSRTQCWQFSCLLLICELSSFLLVALNIIILPRHRVEWGMWHAVSAATALTSTEGDISLSNLLDGLPKLVA